MTRHFGVLIPSTNTTVETELARLPAGYQAHFARLLTTTPGRPKLAEESELSRLRRENARLKEERDILKKAKAYFAKRRG